jgi:hypothetical protein
MANIYWGTKKEAKAPSHEIREYIMAEAEKTLGGKTNFGFRIYEGAGELWIECEDPNDDSSTYWNVLQCRPKIMGWRMLILKCPPGYLKRFEKSKNILALYQTSVGKEK